MFAGKIVTLNDFDGPNAAKCRCENEGGCTLADSGETFQVDLHEDYEGAAPPYGPPGGIRKVYTLEDAFCPECGDDAVEV